MACEDHYEERTMSRAKKVEYHVKNLRSKVQECEHWPLSQRRDKDS